MKLFRPRFTVRQMLIAVAISAVVILPLAEESHRRYLVDYHGQQALLNEHKAGEFHQNAQAALAAGRSAEATQFFSASTYWNEQANGHTRLQKVYRNPWWMFAPQIGA
jgi:hypothetical protein